MLSVVPCLVKQLQINQIGDVEWCTKVTNGARLHLSEEAMFRPTLPMASAWRRDLDALRVHRDPLKSTLNSLIESYSLWCL